VRYGGQAHASPCPRLALDAARDYGVGASLWLGSAGVASSAHFDLFDNLFCVVSSRPLKPLCFACMCRRKLLTFSLN
jgi:hypothetical protein